MIKMQLHWQGFKFERDYMGSNPPYHHTFALNEYQRPGLRPGNFMILSSFDMPRWEFRLVKAETILGEDGTPTEDILAVYESEQEPWDVIINLRKQRAGFG